MIDSPPKFGFVHRYGFESGVRTIWLTLFYFSCSCFRSRWEEKDFTLAFLWADPAPILLSLAPLAVCPSSVVLNIYRSESERDQKYKLSSPAFAVVILRGAAEEIFGYLVITSDD